MYLLAGLGNPGGEYASTRHNIGFMAIDALADAAGFSSKFHGQSAALAIDGEKVVLLKPMTFMNLSGKSVQAAMAFYKIPPENLIVLHDELDLPLGRIRIRRGGGANGHNGIRDIDQAIGTDYWRIRLGIGHPGDKTQVHDYVLSRFGHDEQTEVARVLKAIAAHLSLFWQKSPEILASKLAAELNPPRTEPEKKVQERDGI